MNGLDVNGIEKAFETYFCPRLIMIYAFLGVSVLMQMY